MYVDGHTAILPEISMLTQRALATGKVGFSDQQIDVAHRSQGNTDVHGFGQIRAFILYTVDILTFLKD